MIINKKIKQFKKLKILFNQLIKYKNLKMKLILNI